MPGACFPPSAGFHAEPEACLRASAGFHAAAEREGRSACAERLRVQVLVVQPARASPLAVDRYALWSPGERWSLVRVLPCHRPLADDRCASSSPDDW